MANQRLHNVLMSIRKLLFKLNDSETQKGHERSPIPHF